MPLIVATTSPTSLDPKVVAQAVFTCKTCKAAPAKPCLYASGASKGKPYLVSGKPALHADRLANAVGWIARQPEVDQLTAQLLAAQNPPTPAALPRGAADLGTQQWATSGTVTKVSPGGLAAAHAKAAAGTTLELAAGTYTESLFMSKALTVQAAPGAIVWFDGGGKTAQMLTITAQVLFRGIGFRNGAPTSTENGSNVMVYLGGSAQGSTFEHCWFSKSTKAAIGGEISDVTLRRCTIEDCGYAGAMFGTSTTAHAPDRLTLDSCIIRRINTGGYKDGQVGACKVTRAKDVRYLNTYVEDTNGAPGLWADVSCLRPAAVRCEVNGAGKVATSVGILLEQAQDAIVAGNKVYGCTEAANVLASAKTRIFDNDLAGLSIALRIQQERPKNAGSALNRTFDEASWWTTSTEVDNNKLTAAGGFQIALLVYADGQALGQLAVTDMLAGVKGNTFDGSVQLGRADGSHPAVTDLAAALGAKYSAAAAPVPTDVAAVLAA